MNNDLSVPCNRYVLEYGYFDRDSNYSCEVFEDDGCLQPSSFIPHL
jgi:hypothetical protein